MNPQLPDFIEFKTEYNRLLLFGEEAKSSNPEITKYGSVEVVLEGMLKDSGRICLNEAEYFDLGGFKKYVFGSFYEEIEDTNDIVIDTAKFPSKRLFVSYGKEQDSDILSFSSFDSKNSKHNAFAVFKRNNDTKGDVSYEFYFYSPEYMGFFMDMFAGTCGYLD